MANVNTLFAQADANRDGSLSEDEFRNFFGRNSTFSANSVSFDSSSTTSNAADFAGTEAAASSSSSGAQQYDTDAQGFFKDDNPEIIRRPAQEGPVTYTQNIRVRFLQPPPAPAPGPLIIKEVRAAQPPPPPPLRVRQQAPPLPQPPPLVLRERPPAAPAAVAAQTVVKNLPPIPVPPRSLIIERFPPAPPKPRDIIIERWLPYGPFEKRKTIVQRAAAAKEYPRPRNVIVQYETPHVRVIRQFQRLGVTPEDPQAYVQRYGATLFDSTTLVQQARAAGVVEDISPPAVASSPNFSPAPSPTAAAVSLDAELSAGGSGATRLSAYNTTGELFRSNGFSRRESAYDSFTAADTNRDGVLSPEEFRNAGFR